MGTEKVNLAVIIKNPSNKEEFLLKKQTPPPKFNDPEYDSYQDSDLWDLPSAQLSLLDSPFSSSQVQIEAEDNSLLEFLSGFDLDSAINQVLGQVGFQKATKVKWNVSKVVEEPEFGPGVPVKTVYIVGESAPNAAVSEVTDCCKWRNTKDCADLLLEAKPHNDRIGPLVVVGLLNNSMEITNLNIPPTLRSQEYPPGVKLVPMRSRTAKPFHTTNLVVFVPGTSYDGFGGDNFVASGDALIIDPGCNSAMHKELEHIVTALPRKLVVFVTHHHHDHVDGLSIVQKCNPDATLLAHENTFRRISKDDWSLGYVPVLGSEEICIGGQRLKLISAPGHTDGHMALVHVATNSLIVGDHCVGQGSALLDITSGGNMSDYFHTTYKFMELSPHVLIPMHGRVNMWPKHMLCGYLKNRRNREATILKAIQEGAKTLFDVVAYTYAEVDRSLWIHAASNVRLHVDHLALQNKLPEDFSLENFNGSLAEFAGSVGILGAEISFDL
ncbi:UNVERIFIED_CONTAM: Hydroxyacylglutathione hydrolase [Sesamum radiatum]|uniref:Hydroxyacylglutathione hydrolase n=1 Tax=Sesamum radiatum TaxID=300843 RepID=A0AAW2VLN8_SESRA